MMKDCVTLPLLLGRRSMLGSLPGSFLCGQNAGYAPTLSKLTNTAIAFHTITGREAISKP
jgi:hypothetical protein